MRTQDLEYWVLRLLDSVQASQPVEDARIELKSQWPEDIPKVARQLAAHANAAQGGQLLWVVGVDEKAGKVVGAGMAELARWLPQVQAHFCDLWPDLLHNLTVPFEGLSVVALLFETDRAPYLVKNPNYGRNDGGPVEWEVPWRSNNATRTANRSDLLKILMPLVSRLEFEILDAALTATQHQPPSGQPEYLSWNLNAELYAAAPVGYVQFIPFHHCTGLLTLEEGQEEVEISNIRLYPPENIGHRIMHVTTISERPASLTIESTRDEAVISGPGKIRLNAQFKSGVSLNLEELAIKAKLEVPVHGCDRPASLKMDFRPEPLLEPRSWRWKLVNYPKE